MTTVVKVTKANREALLADPNFVWVGRVSGRLGMKKSLWGNPFRPTEDMTRQECVELFEYCLEQTMDSLDEGRTGPADGPWQLAAYDIHRLRGKRLGCGCGDWKPGEPEIVCHAVCLAKLADAMETTNA